MDDASLRALASKQTDIGGVRLFLSALRVSPSAVSALTITLALIFWWTACALNLTTPLFLPSPREVWVQVFAIASDGYANATLQEHIGASLTRIFLGLVIAAALALPIGVSMGLNRWVKAVFDPPIEFYWPAPPLAYLPLIIIWFGIGETSKIVVLSLAMFAPLCLSAQAGVKGVSQERINAVLALGANRWQVLRHVILPNALPEILTGARIAVGVGWGTLVAAELVAATRGIGFMTLSASHFLNTDVVFVGIGVIALLAFGFSIALRFLEKKLTPWRDKL